MKKFFRRSLACIIAVMMIATSLPFSAITAGAATTKTDTISMNAFGAFRNGTASRVGADYVSTCNDGQNGNFVMAVFTFNVSSLSVNPDDSVSAVFNYYTQFTQGENKGVSFYYPTQHLDEFNIANQYQGQPNSSIWTADDSNHLSRAISYYSLQELQLNIPISSTKTNGQLQIGPAIKYAKRAGTSRAVVIGVIASAGQSGQTGGWTDTSIGYTNQSVTVTVTSNSLSDKEYVVANINSATSNAGSDVYFGNGDSNYISGIKSAGAWADEDNTKITDYDGPNNYNNIKVVSWKDAVAVYTGAENEIRFPVIVQNSGGGETSGTVHDQMAFDHVAYKSGGNFALGNSTWTRCESRDNLTANSETTFDFSSDINVNVSRTAGSGNKETTLSDRFRVTASKTWKNYFKYTGTGNTTKGYDSLVGGTFEVQEDHDINWRDGSWSWSSWAWTTKHDVKRDVTSNNFSLYVLNYAPLKSIIDKDLKKDYETISANEQIYTEESLAKYYKAVANILKFDLMYGVSAYSSDVQNAVAKKGAEIVNLVNSYVLPEKKVFTITFTGFKNNIIETREVNYGDAIGAFPQNTAAEPTMLEGKHYEYTWPTTYTAETVPETNLTIKENEAVAPCTGTATCTARAVCEKCKQTFGAIDSNNHEHKTHYVEVPATCTTAGHSAYDVCNDCHTVIGKVVYDALGHNYEYTYNNYSTHTKTCSRGDIEAVQEAHTNDGTGKCTLCRGTIIDKTALNAAIATAKPIYDSKNTEGTYVTESFNEFKAVYERVTTANPTTQEEVNSLTAELTTATNTLRKATLTYTFYKQVAQKDDTKTVIESSTKSYGGVKEFTITDGDVEKWEIVTDNGTDQPATTTYIKTGENTISLVITRNVQVIAHLAENSTTQPNITKVVFRGRNNAVVAIKYIEANASLATAGVPIPEIPFYHADAWDKTEVFALENGGEITVRAQYTFNGDEKTDKCGIHFTDFEGGVKKFNYDTLVKLNGTSTYYGMYEDEAKTKLLTYFETDEFYAPHNPNIYVYALDSKPTTATVGVTGSYSGTDNDAGKKFATFNCKFYVPEGATVLEWGIKATASGKTITFKSDTKSRRNEYSFRINFAQSLPITSVDAQAYIIYELGGTRKTVFSNNTVTQSF